jgi:hypothetical protein
MFPEPDRSKKWFSRRFIFVKPDRLRSGPRDDFPVKPVRFKKVVFATYIFPGPERWKNE